MCIPVSSRATDERTRIASAASWRRLHSWADPGKGGRMAVRALDRVAAAGLLVGAVFGMAGTFVGSARLQAGLWAIDAVGLVIATSLLTLKFFRAGQDIVAAGFLVFAI